MLVATVILLVLNILLFIVFFIIFTVRFSSKRVLRDIEKELDSLYKDLQREVDGDVSLIEDRTAALKKLIATADKRILLAATEIEKREKVSGRPDIAATVPNASNAPNAPASAPSASSGGVYTRRQIAENAAYAAEKAASSRAPRVLPEIPARDQVVLLAKQDISPDEIAKIVSLPRSEVDLILALNL